MKRAYFRILGCDKVQSRTEKRAFLGILGCEQVRPRTVKDEAREKEEVEEGTDETEICLSQVGLRLNLRTRRRV